jgi:hypothetical protein
MRPLMLVGLIVLILGIASLFIAVPVKERHGVTAGPISVGVTTTNRERLPPVVSGVLIAGGIVLMIVGSRKR